MYFLSFETSSKIFSLALNKDEKVIRYRNLKAAFILEDSILPAMDKLLDSAGIKFSQIDGFAIARDMRARTVPMGTLRISEISLNDRPE